jgi:PIN domain nuclease of toxin-antitoxin system
MDYVTDTHSIVWYFTEDTLLGEKAIAAFEETIEEGLIIVPTVVLAELMFIAKKGKISLTFEETLDKIEAFDNFQIVPLDIHILRAANQIKVDMEMHDQLIVATTMHFEAVLITKDEQIKNSGIVPTIW